jgi:hypothetical protein
MEEKRQEVRERKIGSKRKKKKQTTKQKREKQRKN